MEGLSSPSALTDFLRSSRLVLCFVVVCHRDLGDCWLDMDINREDRVVTLILPTIASLQVSKAKVEPSQELMDVEISLPCVP